MYEFVTKLDAAHELVLLDDALEVREDFGPRRVEGGPVNLNAKETLVMTDIAGLFSVNHKSNQYVRSPRKSVDTGCVWIKATKTSVSTTFRARVFLRARKRDVRNARGHRMPNPG